MGDPGLDRGECAPLRRRAPAGSPCHPGHLHGSGHRLPARGKRVVRPDRGLAVLALRPRGSHDGALGDGRREPSVKQRRDSRNHPGRRKRDELEAFRNQAAQVSDDANVTRTQKSPGTSGALSRGKSGLMWLRLDVPLAERVGFEPTAPCGTPDFESGTIDHSATSPESGLAAVRWEAKIQHPLGCQSSGVHDSSTFPLAPAVNSCRDGVANTPRAARIRLRFVLRHSIPHVPRVVPWTSAGPASARRHPRRALSPGGNRPAPQAAQGRHLRRRRHRQARRPQHPRRRCNRRAARRCRRSRTATCARASWNRSPSSNRPPAAATRRGSSRWNRWAASTTPGSSAGPCAAAAVGSATASSSSAPRATTSTSPSSSSSTRAGPDTPSHQQALSPRNAGSSRAACR